MSTFHYDFPEFILFRDREACSRVKRIKKEEICRHPNNNLRITIIPTLDELFLDYALDVVGEIQRALEENRKLVLLLPARISPYTAEIINTTGLTCRHLVIFNMDEYVDENGNSAPADWPFSFQKMIRDSFINRIDPSLRTPEENLHFISSSNVADYQNMIEDEGGIDVLYGQAGWSGHFAFWDPENSLEFGDDLDAFKKAGPRTVALSPMTVMQNSLYLSGAGDWSWHPPKAVSIGPAQLAGAKRNSWRQYGYIGGGVSWARFITRLIVHGPVTPLVPASILQELNTDFKILESVAENIEPVM
jgi:glucosamine-6-phosphate deaminase